MSSSPTGSEGPSPASGVPPAGSSGQPRVPLWIAPAAVVLGFAAGFTLTVLVSAVGQAFGSPITHPTPAVNIVSNFLFDFSFVAAALYFVTVRGWMGRAEFGYTRIPWRLGIGATLGAAFVYYVVTFIYSSAVGIHHTDKLPSDLGVNQSVAAAIATSVFVCVVAPICEEFFFRGFLFGILRQMRLPLGGTDLGPWVAAAIVGLLFGLAHTGSASSEFLIPLGILGFILCLLRWWTGSLYPGMALHALNNSVALGVNELSWSAGPIVALCIGSIVTVALITCPLSGSRPALKA